ncbi:30S ribosomal protein S20 [Candidatus Peregrinibacteria bacterium CG_4_10_14_0_2_um_filter_38_24]|nr:MAG: 30S ribosomal protein S20 [Candidatus Peregrinibacteria bacterium CG_4_10_14_0_2_um_filter_38_24]PJC39364.1 MAG: 30S ribosomal protein S20 [Candidatus Peregrinibacteria bacterium CG_4_9_14_0_2_um_filter_38_9]
MPVIQSAKKQMRQSLKKRERNTPVRTELKSVFKKMLQFIKDGKIEEAEKFMTKAYSVIDTAAKKNLIHKNNAARKKSRLARNLAAIKTK